MKFKNTLILFVLLILLGGYVYIVEIMQHEKKEARKESSKKIFEWVKDSVEVLDISNAFGNFVLKKIQGEWRIVKPFYTGADESVLNTLLTSLNNAKKDREFNISENELPEYGLGDRGIAVRFELSDGKSDSIWFGDKTPVGSFVFSNKTDSLVFTISESVKNNVNKKLFDLRDKKLLHFKRNDVRSMTIQNPNGKFEFEKAGSEDWMLRNINRPAQSSKLSGVLNKLENNQVKAFVDEEGKQLRKYGLSRPAFRIDLSLGNEKGRRLLVSRQIKGKYYAKDESRKPVFEIDSMLVKDISQKSTDFRSTDFARFTRNQVNRITVAYRDSLITCLKNSSGKWVLDDTSHRAVQNTKLNTFFSNLDYITISEFIKDGKYSAGRYGFNNPSLKISLFDDEKMILEAVFGTVKKDKVYAKTSQYESVYLVPKSKLKDLKLKLDDILEPEPKEDKKE